MIKRVFILSIFLTMSSLMAKGNIVLIDDSKKGGLIQDRIKGCDERLIKEQTKDIVHIKHQLSSILKKLSKIEREKNGILKSRKIRKIRKSKKRVSRHRKKGKYIIVKVKKGDRLADYAKKYYGNSKLYYKIYRANRDKIGDDLRLKVGDRIIIPIDKKHKDKKKRKDRKKRRVIRDIEIVNPIYDIPKVNYSRAKLISPNRDSYINMLDEPVYIDEDNRMDTSDFIPLDEN